MINDSEGCSEAIFFTASSILKLASGLPYNEREYHVPRISIVCACVESGFGRDVDLFWICDRVRSISSGL